MQKKINKQGFTLIELLLVIFIIGLLAAGAIAGYSRYRRSALLDLSVDNLISLINEQRSRAALGNFGGDRFNELKSELEGQDEADYDPEEAEAKCFGMYFEKIAGQELYSIQSFTQKFTGTQVWSTDLGKWVYEGCAVFNLFEQDNQVLKEVEQDESFKVLNIYFADSDASIDNFVIRFIPPDGEMEYVEGPITDTFSLAKNSPEDTKLIFEVRYGESEEEEFMRKIEYDFATGSMINKLFE